MQTTITFKNIKPTDELKSYVNKRLSKIEKLLEDKGLANVVLIKEDIRYIVEIKLDAGKLHINTTEEQKEKNMNSVIDKAVDNIKNQILKTKEKQKNS